MPKNGTWKWVTLIILIATLYYLKTVLKFLFIACVMSYVIYPIVNILNRGFNACGIKNAWSLSSVIAFSILILACIFICIMITFQAVRIYNMLQGLSKIDTNLITNGLNNLRFHSLLAPIIDYLAPQVDSVSAILLPKGVAIVQTLAQRFVLMIKSFSASFHDLFYYSVLIVLSFHAVKDWHKWEGRLSVLLRLRFVSDYAVNIKAAMLSFANDMRQWVTGQCIMINLTALYLTITFALIDLSAPLGIICAYLTTVPIIGDPLCFLCIGIYGLFSGVSVVKIILGCSLILLGHNINGHVIAPILIGGYTGLIPFYMLFGVMLNAYLFGLFGLILNVPLCILYKSILHCIDPTLLNKKNA